MPGLPSFNTTAIRVKATDVLVKAFPGSEKQDFRNLMATHPIIITKRGYNADSVLEKIISVCIVKIWSGAELEEGVLPWLEIKWLGTDPDFKDQGYGMAALQGALRYAQSHGVQDSFGVHADVTATDFYRKFMMANSSALGQDSIRYDDDDLEPVSEWMQGSIEKALSHMPTEDIEVATIDPGAYDSIRCKNISGVRTFQIRFTYEGWKDITEVHPRLSVLNGTEELTVVQDGLLRRLLQSHGITYDNILTAARKSRNIKVSLNSGARTRSTTRQETAKNDTELYPIQYRQENIFASDDMCVILAAANGVHRYNSAKAQQLMDSAPTGRQSFNRVADFLQNTAGIRTENKSNITERSDVLKPDQGLLLCQLVDQNGTRGHAVTIDTDRGVIIDPAEKNEMRLNKYNLNQSCGVASICIGVTNVRKLNLPPDDALLPPRKRARRTNE
jgi:GNAT superfamily N-acetyltransferase